jgi:hypothetical protein
MTPQGRPPRPYLNGATLMTTPTDRQLAVAREAGYEGIEARAERLVDAPDELRAAAAAVRPGGVWSLNGVRLGLGADGAAERERLEAELAPRLSICRALGAPYLLAVPARVAGLDAARALPGVRGRSGWRATGRPGTASGSPSSSSASPTARSGRPGSPARRSLASTGSTSSSTSHTGTRAAARRSTASRASGSPWST